MRKFLSLLLVVGFVVMCFNITHSNAGELDLLLEKLVKKGVITAGEAQEIKTETQEQVKREIAEGTSSSLPEWVQKMKLKGDLRLRYQDKHAEPKDSHPENTNIGRVRVRLGLETKVNDKLLAAIGVASGSGDPRSTNLTFGGYSNKKTLLLDYAYAKYSPLSALNIVAGKMLLNEVLWEPSDLIWDTDITPEGSVIQLKKSLNAADLFMNAGVLIVDADTSTDNNPPMAYLIEPGATYKFNDRFSIKGAFAYDCFVSTKGHVSSSYSGASNSGNTKAGTTKYENNYKMINPSLAFKVMEPFKGVGLDVGFLELFGEYVDNVEVSHDSTGFSAGFKVGDEKVAKWGDKQFKYIYARLGKDSVLDVLPDSDRYGGKTGMRSHEGEFTFGLGKNTSFGIDVYRSYKIKSASEPETLAQFDWNLKF